MNSNRFKKTIFALLPIFVLLGSFGFSVQVDASMLGMQEDHCDEMQMPEVETEETGENHCLRCYQVGATVVQKVTIAVSDALEPEVHVSCPEPKRVQALRHFRKNHKHQRLKEHLSVQTRE
jgi:hypothetical protein